jgi:hypothetical protein
MTNDNKDKLIGGDGMILEVDECLLHKRKYYRGRILKSENIWVFGARCRETKETFICRYFLFAVRLFSICCSAFSIL